MRLMSLYGVIAMLLLACGGQSNKEKKYEEEEIPTGYVGQARVNPYLAAERFLEADGWKVSSKRVWSDFGDETSTIILPASFLTTKGIAMRALDWVNEGGLLVITMKGGEAEINDFQEGHWGNHYELRERVGLDYLMGEVGVEETETDFNTESAQKEHGKLSRDWNVALVTFTQDSKDYEYEVEFEGEGALTSDAGFSWEHEKSEASRMLTADYGIGSVMFLSHARPFRNAYVDRADHPEFLQVIAGWNTFRGEDQVVFLYGSGTSFFDLLWQYAWPALFAGFLLLLFWLWMRIPRFGPLKEDDYTYRRPYGDGLKAAATFLWRKKALEYYFKPLRSRLQGDLNPDGVVEKLTRESDLSEEEVKLALYSQTLKEPSAVTRIVRHLQLLLKR